MDVRNWYRLVFDADFRREKEEEFKRLTLTNDFIFYRVMQNEEICKKLLEIILKVKIRTIKYHETQKFFRKTYMSKGVKLDVYLEDDNNTVYDVEMQARTDRNLPKRSRYYQSVIDVETTRKGTEYDKLKQSYIIILCLTDMFGKGRCIYSFENICVEDNSIRLNDGAKKIFLNASDFDKASDEDIKAFLSYLKDGIPTDEFTKELDEEVRSVRNSDRWRIGYMTLAMKYKEQFEDGRIVGREEGREEGIQEGIQKGKILGIEEEYNRLLNKFTKKNMSEDKNLTYEEARQKAEDDLR